MSDTVETIPEYLSRVRIRDRVKGYNGFRTTRDVADFCGITMTTARKRLLAHFALDEIERRHNGNMYLWRGRCDFAMPLTPSPHPLR